MELKINVDETMFKNVLEKELKAFSSKELHKIIRECIVEALRNDDILRGLFVQKSQSYYSSYATYEPKEILVEAAKTLDLSPAYKELQEKMIAELKTNYSKLLENIMMKIMINGLCNDWDFKSNLELAMAEILTRRAN